MLPIIIHLQLRLTPWESPQGMVTLTTANPPTLAPNTPVNPPVVTANNGTPLTTNNVNNPAPTAGPPNIQVPYQYPASFPILLIRAGINPKLLAMIKLSVVPGIIRELGRVSHADPWLVAMLDFEQVIADEWDMTFRDIPYATRPNFSTNTPFHAWVRYSHLTCITHMTLVLFQAMQQVYDWRMGFWKAALLALSEYCSQKEYNTPAEKRVFVQSQQGAEMAFIYGHIVRDENGALVSPDLLQVGFLTDTHYLRRSVMRASHSVARWSFASSPIT